MQAMLDFPFQDAARGFAPRAARQPAAARTSSPTTTSTPTRDSNAYAAADVPRQPRHGPRSAASCKADNPGADDAELLARDRLAHALMYLSRGNPVVYYGDEQGFTGDGGDQARPAGHVRQPGRRTTSDDDLIGTDATAADDNFVTDHPLYQAISRLAELITAEHPALRDGAAAGPLRLDGPGRLRLLPHRPRPASASTSSRSTTARRPQSADGADVHRKGGFQRCTASGRPRLRPRTATAPRRRLPGAVGGGLRVERPHPAVARPRRASAREPEPAVESHGRMHVVADVQGDSFYEVTFQRTVGHGSWRTIGVDDSAPYQVFDDTASLAPGTRICYRAAVLDNAGHTRGTAARCARCSHRTPR